MKLYIVNTAGQKFTGDGTYSIITEEGECLASHYCSHIGFAYNDLTHDRETEKRISAWKERFGNDVDILHLHHVKDAEAIEKDLIEKCKAWQESHPDHTFSKPSVTLEFDDGTTVQKAL